MGIRLELRVETLRELLKCSTRYLIPPRCVFVHSLSVGIMFSAYALQVRYEPFIRPCDVKYDVDEVARKGTKLGYVSCWASLSSSHVHGPQLPVRCVVSSVLRAMA